MCQQYKPHVFDNVHVTYNTVVTSVSLFGATVRQRKPVKIQQRRASHPASSTRTPFPFSNTTIYQLTNMPRI